MVMVFPLRTFRKHAITMTCVSVAAIIFISCRNEWIDKGEVSLRLGDYALAQSFFGKAIEKNPGDYAARLGLGQALLQKAIAENDSGAFTYALIQFEACRSLQPSLDLSALLGEAYTEKARSRLNQKDTVAALASLNKAIERNPANTEPLNLVGIIYGKLGDADKAEALFHKALALDSNDASAHFNLGMIHWQNGEFALAHDHWLHTLKALPKDEDVLYWFALAEKKIRESP